VAFVPPNVTLEPVTNPVPVTVTVVPPSTVPATGLMGEMTGAAEATPLSPRASNPKITANAARHIIAA